MPAGDTAPGAPTETYYVAVSSSTALPEALSANFKPLPTTPSTTVNGVTTPGQWLGSVRLEPVDSVARVVEDHVDSSSSFSFGGAQQTASPPTTSLTLSPTPYSLGDVVLFINTPNGLQAVDPFTGAREYVVAPNGLQASTGNSNTTSYTDIAMRNDGRLFTVTDGTSNGSSGNTGLYEQLSTADGTLVTQSNGSASQWDGINTSSITTPFDPGNPTATPPVPPTAASYNSTPNHGIQFQALAYWQVQVTSDPNSTTRSLYAIGSRSADDQGALAKPRICYSGWIPIRDRP